MSAERLANDIAKGGEDLGDACRDEGSKVILVHYIMYSFADVGLKLNISTILTIIRFNSCLFNLFVNVAVIYRAGVTKVHGERMIIPMLRTKRGDKDIAEAGFYFMMIVSCNK